jgi:hypothetical protein
MSVTFGPPVMDSDEHATFVSDVKVHTTEPSACNGMTDTSTFENLDATNLPHVEVSSANGRSSCYALDTLTTWLNTAPTEGEAKGRLHNTDPNTRMVFTPGQRTHIFEASSVVDRLHEPESEPEDSEPESELEDSEPESEPEDSEPESEPEDSEPDEEDPWTEGSSLVPFADTMYDHYLSNYLGDDAQSFFMAEKIPAGRRGIAGDYTNYVGVVMPDGTELGPVRQFILFFGHTNTERGRLMGVYETDRHILLSSDPNDPFNCTRHPFWGPRILPDDIYAHTALY